jgi:hypothetical protein
MVKAAVAQAAGARAKVARLVEALVERVGAASEAVGRASRETNRRCRRWSTHWQGR